MSSISRFSSQGITDLEKNADLAIFLVDYLEHQRDPASGAWPGERETRRVQNTCHTVEALSELQLGLISERLVAPALKWLADLPLLRDVLPQDRYAVRIYPVRFKALAALGRFESPRLRADFDDLCKHVDPATGWLIDVPGEFKASLSTLIWLDALLYLDDQTPWQALLDKGLDAVAAAFDNWLAAASPDIPAPGKPTELTNSGDAAYALDLLLRAGRLTQASPATQQALSLLINTVQWHNHDETLKKRGIYGSLQLARHFPAHPAARAAVAALIGEVRNRYQTGAHRHQPDYFHAIILRLLVAHHGTKLRDTILETLWLRNQQTAAHEQDGAEQQQRAALRQLVQQHVGVKLGQVVRLAGTRTRATVYRVHFSLFSDATDNNGHPFSILPDALRLVIKEGSIESLSRTIKRYSELPTELRAYFAKHADNPEIVGADEAQDWYLVMEDLVGLTPLSEMLDRVDLRTAGRPEHAQIARAAASVGEALSALHLHRRRAPIASNELGWLYLTPISEALNRLCESGAFPELKPYLDGFESNGWRYHGLNTYLAKLQRHATTLTPPAIGAVHGDCHSRNLMIDSALARVKFVDIETLNYTDDYLTDYGLLIEDVALYRYLPRGQRPNCLTSDEIITGPRHIHYPFLPRQAEAILLFQQCLIEQIESFAAANNDRDFKPRLWLAIARNLILLASRQIAPGPLDPQRREDTLKLVLVAYAESVRLMDELLTYLDAVRQDAVRQDAGDRRPPLPPLPFTGQAPTRVAASFPLDTLHEAIRQLDHSISYRQAATARHITAYSVEHKPFAELNRDAEPPTLTLAGRMEQYVNAALARADSSGIVLALSPTVPLDEVLGLVRQAYFLALAD